MSSHHLTVAKATFAASLLRPDVTKIDRSELPHFHSLLEAAMRQRLHILYLLNDLLHHAKYHTKEDRTIHDLSRALQPSLLELVQQASRSAKGSVRKRLETLLGIWEDVGYFEVDVMEKARKVINDPSVLLEPSEKAVSHTTSTREAPYIMPGTHGDPSLPFYELPAGNLMLHIVPNKAIPMRAHSIRPLQFAAGPVDESLANAVRDFLKDVETIDHEFDILDDPNVTAEISDMGQVLYRNEAEDLLCKEFSKKFERGQKSKQKSSKEEVQSIWQFTVALKQSLSISEQAAAATRRRFSQSLQITDRQSSPILHASIPTRIIFGIDFTSAPATSSNVSSSCL
ncbi:hypothetical protein DV735_g1799, partial [Chaetothyriales sp. CBS 134920]